MIYLQDSKIQIQNSQQVAKVFQGLLMLEDKIDRDKEHYYVMHLNTKSQVKMVELVSMGTINASLVHPRETFRRAVIEGPVNIIIAHNHPSGEADPSEEDIKVTRLMHEAGKVLGISLLDHIIFTHNSFYSFKDCRVQKITEA